MKRFNQAVRNNTGSSMAEESCCRQTGDAGLYTRLVKARRDGRVSVNRLMKSEGVSRADRRKLVKIAEKAARGYAHSRSIIRKMRGL